jgi:PTS system fructose-specific IIC component
MLDRLRGHAQVQDLQALTEAVFDRQQTDPPLFPGGVAFPHARTNSVSSLVMVIATCAQPIPFGDVPVRLIFLIGIPKRAGAEYLELISFLARHVRGEQVVDRLVAAEDMSSFLAGFAVGP